MSEKFDVVVIGAGPGGYVAAIKSAKLGMKTAVIEEREVGGTCLNRGCIPAKAMIHASTLYREIKEADRFGISASDVTYDFEKILEYKEQTTGQLVQGVEQLLQANGVTRYYGKGTLFEGKKVKITGNEEQSVEAENVILASGSKPLILPIPGMDLPRVLTSDELFKLKEVPKSLVIIGGGVISVEFATVYSALGSKVTILEAMPRLVPNMDKEIAQNLKLILKKRGVESHTSAAVQGVYMEGDTCVYTDPEIASAGITEDAAKEQGIKVKTGKFIMSANGKSLITKEERGFIKIVADEETDVILGAQMMCARATDMIGEFVTAIANKMTVAQLLKGMRAHPTYNEGIGEALEEAEGGAIHVVPKKKK